MNVSKFLLDLRKDLEEMDIKFRLTHGETMDDVKRAKDFRDKLRYHINKDLKQRGKIK